MLTARRRPARQQSIGYLFDAVIVVAAAAELQPASILVPAEVHGIRQVIERLEQRLIFDRHCSRCVEARVEVGDDGPARGAVEGFEHIGGRHFGFRAGARSAGPVPGSGRLDFGLERQRRTDRTDP